MHNPKETDIGRMQVCVWTMCVVCVMCSMMPPPLPNHCSLVPPFLFQEQGKHGGWRGTV